MQTATKLTLSALTAPTLGGAALLTPAARPPAAVERTDFGVTRTPVTAAYDAGVRPASTAPVKALRVPMTHETVEIA